MTTTDNPGSAAAQPSILARIRLGQTITVSQDKKPLYVDPNVQGTPLLNGSPGDGAMTDFLVIGYEYDGTNEAKIFLEPVAMPGVGWALARQDFGVDFPVIIGTPTTFMLNDLGNGQVSIQTCISPPGPYVRGVKDDTQPVVTYGYVEAGEQGAFDIAIVN